MAEYHLVVLFALDLAQRRLLINTHMLLLLEIFGDLFSPTFISKTTSYLLRIWRLKFLLDEACVNIFGTHGLIKPIRNDRYLLEAGVVSVLLVTDLTSVLFQVLSSLGVLAWLLFDVDFAGLVLGGRHCLQAAMDTQSMRTVAIDRQIVFAVLKILESRRTPLRYDLNVW